jgi:DNA-binding CsgD family transcriptional regulator
MMRTEIGDSFLTPFGDPINLINQRGGIFILQGGPGTGKTFHLDEVKRLAIASDSLCLHATGFREEHEIPFSAFEQFIHVPGIPDTVRSAVWRLVRRTASATPSGLAPARLLQDLFSALVAAAKHTGMVILIDDAQYLDADSHSCLLYLARRAQSHNITMVVAYPPDAFCDGIGDRLGLLGLPGACLLKATSLRENDVRTLLKRGLGAEGATRLAAPVHRISGGNPALAAALVRDLRVAGSIEPDSPVPVGDAFRTAYLAGLAHHPCLAKTVQALAVLGDDATPARAAQLLESHPHETAKHIAALECAGFLGEGGFRHPAVPGAVLGMLGAELASLHRRAAALLVAEGAPALAVAQHLLAAQERPDASLVPVLRRAWQQLLVAGQTDRALACLRLADQAELSDKQRAEITAELVHTLVSVNPLAAEPEVGRLLAAARAGRADCRALRLLVAWLLWFGQRDRAREVLVQLVETCDPSHADDGKRALSALIGCLWPEVLGDPAVRGYFRTAQDSIRATRYGATAVPPSRTAVVHSGRLRRLLSPLAATEWNDDHEAAGRRAASADIDARPFWNPDLAAVLELVQEGETTLADRLCEEKRARLPADEFPARHALLAALRGHVRGNLGDPRTASECAQEALALLHEQGWGVAVGLPLSVLISAHTLMGDPSRAARYLERPVPDEMWDSSFGPLYRIALGCYLLETGRPDMALNEFIACAPKGEDRPSAPLGCSGWHAHAAEAYLALGEPEQARRMAEAELLQGDRPTDARGRALRILAVVDAPEQRRAHLEEAERTLRGAHSRLPLAQVLAQLSQVDLADGHTRTARARWKEALSLAATCGAPHRLRPPASPLDEPLAPPQPAWTEGGQPAATGPAPRHTTGAGGLTEAEWRVASLAAAHRSNRQIAAQLYITVSTVEQHLTRVYRKLSVRRRSDLPGLLGLQSQERDQTGFVL